MVDYYNILGVSKTASSDEIKTAYKKLALKNHPDRGGNKDQFQKIQEAYEVLSDSDKKSQYDNPHSDFSFDNPFFNQFNHQFNHQTKNSPVKKNDYHYTCNITLDEVFSGSIKKLKVQRKYGCKICFNTCNACNGLGKKTQRVQLGPFQQVIEQTCSNCSGSGKKYLKNESCSNCDCDGIIIEDKIFEIKIDRGIENGKMHVFKDWGEQPVKSNEIPGSFIVTISILPHDNFQRERLKLKYKVKLSVRESIVGKNIVIPHFNENINLNTVGFGLINPNKEYIVFKKGLVNEKGECGDLHIRFEIEYQERSFNDSELLLLNEIFDKIEFP